MADLLNPVSRRSLFSLFAGGAGALSQVTEDTSGWQAFSKWARKLEAESFQQGRASILSAYRTGLIQGGRPVTEADAIVAQVSRYISSHPSAYTKLVYDRIYESGKRVFTTEPNAFLAEAVATLRPGRALDLGMGEGRNTLFLAQRGWDVLGIDLSAAGIDRAKERAERLGLKITTLVQDANEFDYGSDRWDLVCVLYFSGYDFVRDIEKRVTASLRPGGHVVMEGPAGSPKAYMDRWTRWEPFGLRVIRLEFRAETADWGQPDYCRMLLEKRTAG